MLIISVLFVYQSLLIMTHAFTQFLSPLRSSLLKTSKIPLGHLKATIHSDSISVKDEVMMMRASEIKKILTSLNADTRGLYDKDELGNLLVSIELDHLSKHSKTSMCTTPMFEVALGSTKQTYVGLNIEIKGKTFRFMVDTGATMNLVKPEVIKQLNLISEQQMAYTVGVGGGGNVAAQKTTIDQVYIGGKYVSMEAAILENAAALPPTAQGILGLGFLSSLGDVVEFNFDTSIFSFGSRSTLLSPLQKRKFHEIKTRRIFSGLIATDLYVNDGNMVYTAMLDMGSAHTIANPLAVEAALGRKLESLPKSSNMCAGIDGNPVVVRIDSYFN